MCCLCDLALPEPLSQYIKIKAISPLRIVSVRSAARETQGRLSYFIVLHMSISILVSFYQNKIL